MSQPFDPLLITRQSDLDRLCEAIRAEGAFAFDTEFVGEDSFQPVICLLQIASEKVHAVVDPMASEIDDTAIWNLVADPSVRKLVHAGSEDLAQCVKRIGRPPANVVDLQIAAGFVGLGYPISLSRLTSEAIKVKLHKSQTLTDWRRRPLGEEQIHYAVEDVIHLPAIDRHLMRRLDALGRTDWLLEECEALCRTAARPSNDEKRAKRLKGSATLTRKQLAIVRAILEVRDQLAERYNRPSRAILKDHLVVEIARRGWTESDKLRTLRGLSVSNSDLKRFADAVATAKASDPESWPLPPLEEPSPEEDMLLSFLATILRIYCEQHDLAYSILATKQDLRLFLKSSEDGDALDVQPALRTGWRARAVGELLDRVLTGRAAVRLVKEGKSSRLVIE